MVGELLAIGEGARCEASIVDKKRIVTMWVVTLLVNRICWQVRNARFEKNHSRSQALASSCLGKSEMSLDSPFLRKSDAAKSERLIHSLKKLYLIIA